MVVVFVLLLLVVVVVFVVFVVLHQCLSYKARFFRFGSYFLPDKKNN